MNIQNYFQIDVMPVHQTQTGFVFLGKISFKDLLAIHRLTERKVDVQGDPFSGTRKDAIKKEDQEFQRQLSNAKLNKISKFLKEGLEKYSKNQSVDFFPTSIILALDHNDECESASFNEDLLGTMYSTDLESCFVSQSKTKLFIPKNSGIALIVDGQHRFYGTKMLCETLPEGRNKEIIENFEFITTFLIGYDMYELGKVFATVNFEQKPVNRSLYYDIFGSFPDPQRNDIKLAHDLAVHLNNNESSPIRGMIKMLGKGYGLFSQAFFVEKMLIHFKEKGVWEKIYTDYLNGGKEFKKLPIFMKAYLNSIKEVYSSAWPEPVLLEGKEEYSPRSYDYVMCKTTGMGALLMLIKEIYPLVEKMSDSVELKKRISEKLNKISKQEAREIFLSTGNFGQGGSLGMQKKLYDLLKLRLKL